MYRIEQLQRLQKNLIGKPLQKARWVEYLYRMDNLFHWGIENPTTEEMIMILEKQETKLVKLVVFCVFAVLLGCVIAALIV